MTFIGEFGLIGRPALTAIIGLVIFIFVFRYSKLIFEWIENQTLGTRTYLMEKLEFLMITVDPDKVTLWLTSFSLIVLGLTVITMGLLLNWTVGFIMGLIFGFFSFRLPKVVIDYFVEKRIQKYQSQMVDGLQLLSNGIRAGLSVPQALGMVVGEMPAPLSEEFNIILQQNRIGVPLEECFDNLCKRIPTEDNDMFVSSVNILRESGGNLAEVFDTIVLVIRERIRLQQKIDTFTAQGMFQGVTIALMPLLIGLVYSANDPDSMARVFSHPLGIVMLFVAIGLDIVGFLIIKKVVKIKI
jgi:tight adherence protein B